MSWNITINNEQIIFQLSIEEGAAARATLAAKRAEDADESAQQTLQAITDLDAQLTPKINEGLTDIEESKSGAINNIDSAKSDAIDSIDTAKTDALTAIEDTKSESLQAINQQAISALSSIEAAESEATQQINNSLTDIEQARTVALSDIDTAKTGAVDEVNTAKTEGVDAVNTAKTEGIDAVNTAKTTALSEINPLVTAAQTARQGAEDAETRIEGIEQNVILLEGQAQEAATTATTAATTATNEASLINQKIDLATPQVAGGILRSNGVQYVPINERRQAFLADTDPLVWQFFDTFKRPNSNSLGTADSGQAWIQTGNNRIVSGYFNGDSNSGTVAIIRAIASTPIANVAIGKKVQFRYFGKGSGGSGGSFGNCVIVFIDDNNFVEVRLADHRQIIITRFLNGISTNLAVFTNGTKLMNNFHSQISIAVNNQGVTVYGDENNLLRFHPWLAGSDELNWINNLGGLNFTGLLARTQGYIDNFRVADLSINL
jgi:hypothetical protein